MTLSATDWRARYLASQIVVARCVLHLRQAGLEVYDLAQPIPHQDRDEKRYPDSGDILIDGRGRVECKGRNLDFPPYPYDSVFLGQTYQYEGKPHPIYGIMIVNKALSGFLWVSATTRPKWTTKATFDHYHKKDIESLACPTWAAKWVPFRDVV